jgi:hypothetical protein
MATLPQLKQALLGAHQTGDTDAARRLAQIIKTEEGRRAENPNAYLIIAGEDDHVVPGTVSQPPEPTLGDRAVGAGEALLTTATGATTGFVGMMGGTLKGILEEMLAGEFGSQEAANRIEEEAMNAMSKFTYQPRTEVGQELLEAIGEIAEPLVALTPMMAEIGAAGTASRAAANAGRAVAQERVVAPIAQRLEPMLEQIRQRAPGRTTDTPTTTPGTGTTAGAGAVDQATIRQNQANELPVPISLTEGQRTRSFEQQRFERETAKLPEEGAPLRERFREQNELLQQNMDEFIDMTGAELGDLRGVGELVDRALRNRAARDKTRIRSLYREAENAGELETPTTINRVADFLNTNRAERAENGIMGKVQRQIDALEIGQGTFEDGTLQLRPVTLQEAEALRRFVNRNVNSNDPNDIRIGMSIKDAIDQSTEGLGGNLYQRARQARRRYAEDYENVGLVRQLLGTKRGSEDRAIALEEVLNKSILTPASSLDMVRDLRRLLQTEGDTGKQAWRELQGGTLRHIRDQALKNVARDDAGNAIISPSQVRS